MKPFSNRCTVYDGCGEVRLLTIFFFNFIFVWIFGKETFSSAFSYGHCTLTCSPVENDGDPGKGHDHHLLSSWSNTSDWSFLVYKHLNLWNYNIISVGISISVILTSWLAIFLQWHSIFHCNSTTVAIMFCAW